MNHSAKGLGCFPITDRDEGRVLTQSNVSPVAQPSRCRDYVDPGSQSLRDCEVPELLDRDVETLDQALARAISTGRSPPLITAAGACPPADAIEGPRVRIRPPRGGASGVESEDEVVPEVVEVRRWSPA